MREPGWVEDLRWNLLSVADWFTERNCWRMARFCDRCSLSIYRIFHRSRNGTA